MCPAGFSGPCHAISNVHFEELGEAHGLHSIAMDCD